MIILLPSNKRIKAQRVILKNSLANKTMWFVVGIYESSLLSIPFILFLWSHYFTCAASLACALLHFPYVNLFSLVIILLINLSRAIYNASNSDPASTPRLVRCSRLLGASLAPILVFPWLQCWSEIGVLATACATCWGLSSAFLICSFYNDISDDKQLLTTL